MESIFFRGNRKPESKIEPPTKSEPICYEETWREYEGTNVWSTRDSIYWRWQRVKEWHRQFADNSAQWTETKLTLRRLGLI